MNILYGRSKWIFHTVCWGVVGCKWGTTSVYCACFITSRLPVFALGRQYQHLNLYYCQEYHLKDTHKIFKNHVGLKLEWVCRTNIDYVGNFFHLRFSSIPLDALLGVTYANMLVATQWPLKRAPHLTCQSYLRYVCILWLWGFESQIQLLEMCSI